MTRQRVACSVHERHCDLPPLTTKKSPWNKSTQNYWYFSAPLWISIYRGSWCPTSVAAGQVPSSPFRQIICHRMDSSNKAKRWIDNGTLFHGQPSLRIRLQCIFPSRIVNGRRVWCQCHTWSYHVVWLLSATSHHLSATTNFIQMEFNRSEFTYSKSDPNPIKIHTQRYVILTRANIEFIIRQSSPIIPSIPSYTHLSHPDCNNVRLLASKAAYPLSVICRYVNVNGIT